MNLDVITLADDETVQSPGFVSCSMDRYHSQGVCPGPSISSSGLRTIENECPYEFWAFSELNPKRFVKEEKDHFAFGRAAHCLILGGETWEGRYAVLPEDAPKRPTVTQIKAREEGRVSDIAAKSFEFWDEWDRLTKAMTVITADDYRKIEQMADQLQRDPMVQAGLLNGPTELSMIWKDAETGVWLKSRPDVLPLDGAIADYKSTASVSKDKCARDITKFGYHMQMALAFEGWFALTGRWPLNAVLIFQQKPEPFHVLSYEIDADAIYWGRCQVRRAINTFAECLDTGEWPGYADGIPVYSMADWQASRLATEQASGLLPNLTKQEESA